MFQIISMKFNISYKTKANLDIKLFVFFHKG